MTKMPSTGSIISSSSAERLLHDLAAIQPAEGTMVGENTWIWVQAFADFDYEYAYLIDVRRNPKGAAPATSDYMALFKGYDAHGVAVVRATWWGHPGEFPNVPNLYDALAWWAGWVKETRQGFGLDESNDSRGESPEKVD